MGIFIYFLVEQYTFIIIWLLILFCIWPVIRKVWPSAVKDWNCPCVDKCNVIYCIWGGGVWCDDGGRVLRKLTPLPHHSASSTIPVLCLYLCSDLWLINPPLSRLPILSRLLHSVLLHAEMVPNSVSVFICVHPPSHDALWLPTLGLPRPVLLCLQSVSLSLTASLFPSPLALLRHSSHLFLSCRSRSDRGGGVRRRGRQECHILSCADTCGLSLYFCSFFRAAFVAIYVVKDGRAWAQTQR